MSPELPILAGIMVVLVIISFQLGWILSALEAL